MFMGAQCEKSKKIALISRGPKRRKKTSYLFDDSWRSSPNVSVGCSGDALSLSQYAALLRITPSDGAFPKR